MIMIKMPDIHFVEDWIRGRENVGFLHNGFNTVNKHDVIIKILDKGIL